MINENMFGGGIALRRRMMLMGMEENEVKEVGTFETNPTDGTYGSITFSVPHDEGIHYYLIEQTDIACGSNNRLVPAMLFRRDNVHGYSNIILQGYAFTAMSSYGVTDGGSGGYLLYNEDGTFTYIGSSGLRFNQEVTYHMYHLAEGNV